MTGYNKLQLSIADDTGADQYKNRFISFIKAIEAKKNDQGGLQFDYQNAINMKMDAEDLYALAFAAQKYADGQFANYENTLGGFQKFADSSKSTHGEGGSKKSLSLSCKKNEKSGKIIFYLSFNADKKSISISFNPYTLYAFSKLCYNFAEKIYELEGKRGGVIVPSQVAPKASSQGNGQKYNAPPKSNFNNGPDFGEAPSFGGIESGFEDAMQYSRDDIPPPLDAPPF
jgi:hypothetical protein